MGEFPRIGVSAGLKFRPVRAMPPWVCYTLKAVAGGGVIGILDRGIRESTWIVVAFRLTGSLEPISIRET